MAGRRWTAEWRQMWHFDGARVQAVKPYILQGFAVMLGHRITGAG